MKICILAAGHGTRMKSLFPNVPKLLIPINGKTTLERQLEQIPNEWEILIVINPVSSAVVDFVKQFYSHKKIQFVFDHQNNERTRGPAQSLLCAVHLLNGPFWLLFSDTLWNECLPEPNGNLVCVGDYKSQPTERFCNFKIDARKKVEKIFDKVQVSSTDDMKPFIGLAHLQDEKVFFDALTKDREVEDHQLTQGFNALIGKGLETCHLSSWIDVGTPETYELAKTYLMNS